MTTFVIRNRLATIAAVIGVALAAVIILARSPIASQAMSDGDHDVRVVSQVRDGTVTVDPVEVLSGQEAVAAAVADGFVQPAPEDGRSMR